MKGSWRIAVCQNIAIGAWIPVVLAQPTTPVWVALIYASYGILAGAAAGLVWEHRARSR
ncbi:MAG TPA: hypothetical protein VFQ44_01830 [Streptosporangiaceae bacterium]|nr:hypothetical protein [Streptosporangiaceae bacterium]